MVTLSFMINLCLVDLELLWSGVEKLSAEDATMILSSVRRLQIDPASFASGLCPPEARRSNPLAPEVFSTSPDSVVGQHHARRSQQGETLG